MVTPPATGLCEPVPSTTAAVNGAAAEKSEIPAISIVPWRAVAPPEHIARIPELNTRTEKLPTVRRATALPP
jgi:hypothetical protein